MLGTNDVNQAFDPGGPGYGGGTGFAADAAGRLNALIDRLYAENPALTLVVAAITPLADPAKERTGAGLRCPRAANRRRAPEAGSEHSIRRYARRL